MGVLNYAPEPRGPLDCPHCGNPALSAGAKLWLGPVRTVRCRSCGERVSVAWGRSVLVLSLFLGPLLVLNLIHLYLDRAAPPLVYAVGLVALLIGAVAMFRLYVNFVPLVKR